MAALPKVLGEAKTAAGNFVGPQSVMERNTTAVILAHAATIDTTSSCEFSIGPHVRVVELTCVSQTGTTPVFTIGLDRWDEGDQTWISLITSASITGAATTSVQINPIAPPITNASTQHSLGPRMRATVTYTSGTATGSLSVTVS